MTGYGINHDRFSISLTFQHAHIAQSSLLITEIIYKHLIDKCNQHTSSAADNTAADPILDSIGLVSREISW